jgi:hypothetical protein
MNKNYWARFTCYQKIIDVFFMLNIILDVINNELLNSVIPFKVLCSLFWLSLGLFLGFKLCKKEYSNAIKKNNEQQK